MKRRSTIVSIVICLALVGCASALKKSPVDNLNGLGPVHHPISTKSAEAQRAFNEGLARLYGFNHDAARIAFEKTLASDPDCAMAHWGIALVVGPNYNLPEVDADALKAAYTATQEATKRASGATQKERDYIDAISKRYSSDPKADTKKLQADYASAMGQLAKKYPDDLDAATLWAESMMNLRPWRLWRSDGSAEEGTETIVATLERVLARDPNHIGANHYYIHAVEASFTPERAMKSAQRLPTLAPKQGHLVHMPSHVYIRTGDYEAAIRANEAAIAADDEYFTCCGPKPTGVYPMIYYNHNIHFLMAAACMTNASQTATDAANRLAQNVAPYAKEEALLEPLAAMPHLVRVRFAKWDEILAQPAPDAALPTVVAADQFSRVMAHVAKGDLASARTAQVAFEASRSKLTAVTIGNNTVVDVMQIASHLLAGRVEILAGNVSRGIENLQQAVTLQDKLIYDEPPPLPWPMREALGAALLASGDAPAAEKVFREDLRRHPKNPRSLLGVCEALRAQGINADAETSQLKAASRSADVELTLSAF